MEKKFFENTLGDRVAYLKWEVSEPKAVVVIAHGMVEHPGRYDDFAVFLNGRHISVYAICHIGHGEDAALLRHLGKGDFDRCISNLHELVTLAREEIGKPVLLLGHSMGSFMSQLYVTRYQDLDGLILSGSTKASMVAKAGAVVATILNALHADKTRPSKFMNDMAFGAYNKAFPENKTEYDWLSRDEKQVEKYIQDPLCGGVCSVSFYQNLTAGMAKMGRKQNLRNVDRQLPIYIQGGSMDPVSEMGKGLYALKAQYDAMGMKRVELDVYEGARHEILNETNKDEVYQNTLTFIESVIG